MNRPQNEFIWVRTYRDKAELEAKTKEFQAAVAVAGVKLGGNVAKMEVREAESAFAYKSVMQFVRFASVAEPERQF